VTRGPRDAATDRRVLRGGRELLAAVAVAAVIPMLLGVALLVTRDTDPPLTSNASAVPLLVPVGRAQRLDPVGVGVKVVRRPGLRPAVATAGTVTAVTARQGRRLDSGAGVVTLDDRRVVAFVGAAPLWRDVGPGSRGADVRRVQTWLAGLGFNPGTGGRVDARTGAAIREFNRSIGAGADGSTLRRSTVVWIGAGPLLVGKVLVEVGATVAAGSAVVEGPAVPATVEVSEPRGGPATGGSASGGDGTRVLAVADAVVPYRRGSGSVSDPTAVAAVAAALGAAAEGTGEIRLAQPVQVVTVPASAVLSDPTGRTCVLTAVGSPPIPVTPVGGGLSVVELPVTFTATVVLANPREVGAATTCGPRSP
jgi:peptidoglycan hydrolase-like protein with peptidoglycan-binding domain